MLPSVAWVETDSILIKEKRKHLSKTFDRVSKKMKRKRLSLEKEKSIHRSIYRYTKVNSLSYIFIQEAGRVIPNFVKLIKSD
jgi:hypothetical protein